MVTAAPVWPHSSYFLVCSLSVFTLIFGVSYANVTCYRFDICRFLSHIFLKGNFTCLLDIRLHNGGTRQIDKLTDSSVYNVSSLWAKLLVIFRVIPGTFCWSMDVGEPNTRKFIYQGQRVAEGFLIFPSVQYCMWYNEHMYIRHTFRLNIVLPGTMCLSLSTLPFYSHFLFWTTLRAF